MLSIFVTFFSKALQNILEVLEVMDYHNLHLRGECTESQRKVELERKLWSTNNFSFEIIFFLKCKIICRWSKTDLHL